MLAVGPFEVTQQEIALKPVNKKHDNAKHRDNQRINPKRNEAAEVKHNGIVGIGQVEDHHNDDERKYGIDERLQPLELPAIPLLLACTFRFGREYFRYYFHDGRIFSHALRSGLCSRDNYTA